MSLFTTQPINSGSRALDVALNMIQNAVRAAFDTLETGLRSLLEPEAVSIDGNYTMTDENVLVYVGAGGSTIVLPPANSLEGRRSRPRFILNTAARRGNAAPTALSAAVFKAQDNAAAVLPSGGDTVNGGSAIPLNPGVMLILVSDGISAWRAQTALLNDSINPFLTSIAEIDPASGSTVGKFAARISSVFKASANVGTGRNTAAYQIEYTVNANGNTMSSTWRGLRVVSTETDLGGAANSLIRAETTGGGALVALDVDSTGLMSLGIAETANGGGAAPTLGTIGGSGPGTAAQSGWMKVKIGGSIRYIPVWG